MCLNDYISTHRVEYVPAERFGKTEKLVLS